jgi:hypothetical protein
MTTISAKIIKDSVSPYGVRLTTMQLRYPRWIHAEGRTHRVMSIGEDELDGWEPRTPSLMQDPNLSRNASSSRAIPISRLIDDVLTDPAVPLYWGRNEPGMQATKELSRVEQEVACGRWMQAMESAVHHARMLAEIGAHKQLVNRLLEPFSHINVVVTATEWANFFLLRRHSDAEPHIKILADRMYDAMTSSAPELLAPGEWHLPYVRPQESGIHAKVPDLIKISTARCARVSYYTHEGLPPKAEDDIVLFDRLVGSIPLHASPAEHQGTPDTMVSGRWYSPELHGNLKGWVQHRKMLSGEAAWGPI